MDKGTHFIGQPAFGQLISLLDKSKILKISREVGGERYVKKFDAWQHMVIMLYAIIKRFDSLREISDSMFPEARKLAHIGVRVMPRRSTLSDANARRPEKVFEAAYKDLYSSLHDELSSDSRKRQNPKWMDKLKIMDSTTISLFSNLIFKGVGRNPKTGKKKGGIKVHKIINANEGVSYDTKFTSAATHDSFMLLKARGIRISMTECGDPKDNAVAERVNGIIKNELLKDMAFHSIEEVKAAVADAIDFYNNERPHMSLDWKTPAEAALCSGELKKKWVSHRENFLKQEVA